VKAYTKLGNYEKAQEAYNDALKNDPSDAISHHGLGNCLAQQGSVSKAIDLYEKALQLDPDNAHVFRKLTMVKRFSEYDRGIEHMEKLYRKQGISKDQKIELAFGLGKVFEDLGNYDKSFNYIHEGNQLKHGPGKHDIEGDRRYFAKHEEVFNMLAIDRYEMAGCLDECPIFIVGMPRSGTTLLEQILASHPEVHGAGELNYLYEITQEFSQKHTNGQYPENFTQLAPFFAEMGAEYINKTRVLSTKATFIVDKMPHNFIFIGLIHLILPKAKIIHCRRNALDTCWSTYKNLFDNAPHYPYDLNELGEYYCLYFKLIEYWHKVLPQKIHDVNYEDLTTDPTQVVKKILDYCDLEWNEDCLNFYKRKKAVQTVSYAQVNEPIHRKSIQRWKNYEKHLQPLTKILKDSGVL